MPEMKILIGPYEFHLRAPYTPGHVLTHAEAAAFNEWRARGVVSNMRAVVNEAERSLHSGELLSDDVLAFLQTAITAFDAEYAHPMERGTRKTKNTLAPRLGLIEKIAREEAAKWLVEKNRRDGRKLHDADFDAEVARLADGNEYWRDKAREIIRMRMKAANGA